MNTMTEYSNREIDRMFKEITDMLVRIETQTTKTNGRVTRLEKILLVVGAVVASIIIANYPDIIKTIQLFI